MWVSCSQHHLKNSKGFRPSQQTNAGRVNVPVATEETPSLVLALEADAEENKGCGAPLAEMPGTEEESCEEVFLWMDEIMARMEFPIAWTTASVRESANWGDQELEAVLDTGLSDVAVDGRESSVGRPADKLLLVERDGRGITEDNQKLSSRGRTTTGKTTNNGNENHFDRKKLWQNQEEKLCYSNWETKLTKTRAEPRETLRYWNATPRHANKASSTTQTQRRHVASACAKATYRWTGICPRAHEHW